MSNQGGGRILKCTVEYDPHIPEVTLSQYILSKLKNYEQNIALVHCETKEQVTYRKLSDAILCMSAALQTTQKLKKGEFVGLVLPNCVEFTISLLAINQCGGVASFVNPLYTQREIEHVAGIIKPAFWICIPEFVPALAALKKLGYNSEAIVVNLNDKKSSPWHSLLASGRPESFIAPKMDVFQDLATMPFSSGTTGLPKGVMLSHHNLVTALCQFKTWCPYTEKDVALAILPMYHQYGCLNVLTMLAVGATNVLLPKFDFLNMLKMIQEYKVTTIPLVPPIAVLLAKHPATKNFNLSSLKYLISSAAPLSSDVIDIVTNKYNCQLLQGYGMTECTFATHFTPLGYANNKRGTVGKVMPFYEAKVVDPNTGKLLGAGEVGEFQVKGYMVMKGYRGNPGETAAMIDDDGWLHTGDMGYYDEDAYFYVVDRMKELIKYKGMQVAPSELEHLLLTHPEVMDAAVIGVPDEMAGELPRAYVVKKAGSLVTEKDIIQFIDGQVSGFKKLRGGVVFLAAIPKLASGKILRRQLRDQLKSNL